MDFGNRSRIDPNVTYRRHKSNQGGVPEDIFRRKRSYVWQRPHFRSEQRYDTFFPEWKPFENPALKGKTFGDKAWFGKKGVEYVAFIGLSGETSRTESSALESAVTAHWGMRVSTSTCPSATWRSRVTM